MNRVVITVAMLMVFSFAGLERNYMQLLGSDPVYYLKYAKLKHMESYYKVDEDKLGVNLK